MKKLKQKEDLVIEKKSEYLGNTVALLKDTYPNMCTKRKREKYRLKERKYFYRQ